MSTFICKMKDRLDLENNTGDGTKEEGYAGTSVNTSSQKVIAPKKRRKTHIEFPNISGHELKSAGSRINTQRAKSSNIFLDCN